MRRVCTPWIALLLAAGLAVPNGACAEDGPDSTGTIEGEVRIGKKPASPYLNVILIGSHRGTQTDDQGHFVFRDVPVGTWTVRAMDIGVPAVDQTVRVEGRKINRITLKLEDRTDPAYIARHRTRPNRDLIRRIRECTSMRAFRVTSDPAQSFDSTSIFRLFRITSELPTPPRENVDALAAILEDPRLYGGLDTDKKLCIFDPGVGLLLRGSKGTIKALICLRCAEMGFWMDPKGPHARVDFQKAEPDVRAWVAELLGAENVPEDVH